MKSILSAVLIVLLGVGGAIAQEVEEKLPEDRFRSEVRLDAILLDNLFQAPDGEPQEDVTGGRLELRGGWDLTADGRWNLYGRIGHTEYDSGIDASQNVGLGLRGENKIHGIDLFGEYFNDRPSVEADLFDQADVTRLTATYELRPVDAWQLSLKGVVEQQSYEAAVARDNDFSSVGAAIRFRGFGRAFSPEIGFSTGSRDVDNGESSHDEDEYFARILSAPTEALYLSLRYRLRDREYTTGDPTASNFGRQDDRAQWAFNAAYESSPRLAWNLYLTREKSDSTRPDVDFETGIATFGVAIRLD